MRNGLVLLAADTPHKAAPLGLLVITLLGVGVYFLGRSMMTHLKRVPVSFDQPGSGPDHPPAPGSVGDPPAVPGDHTAGPV